MQHIIRYIHYVVIVHMHTSRSLVNQEGKTLFIIVSRWLVIPGEIK